MGLPEDEKLRDFEHKLFTQGGDGERDRATFEELWDCCQDDEDVLQGRWQMTWLGTPGRLDVPRTILRYAPAARR